MAVAPHLPSPALTRRKTRRSLMTWTAVGCVAAVLIEVALFTNGFGLLGTHGTGGTTPPGPNPNPYDVNVTSVTSDVAYHGPGLNPFPGLVGAELCDRCPVAPRADYNFTPAVAVLYVYFNVTNTGGNWTNLSNFTLTTSGSDPGLFTLASITQGPDYSEPTNFTSFTPGMTKPLLATITAESVPPNGSSGYSLTLDMLCT